MKSALHPLDNPNPSPTGSKVAETNPLWRHPVVHHSLPQYIIKKYLQPFSPQPQTLINRNTLLKEAVLKHQLSIIHGVHICKHPMTLCSDTVLFSSRFLNSHSNPKSNLRAAVLQIQAFILEKNSSFSDFH